MGIKLTFLTLMIYCGLTLTTLGVEIPPNISIHNPNRLGLVHNPNEELKDEWGNNSDDHDHRVHGDNNLADKLHGILKHVGCGELHVVMSAIKKYKENPVIVLENQSDGTQTLVFINLKTNSSTIVEMMADGKTVCIIATGDVIWTGPLDELGPLL
jgi:hypothetical protein